MSLESDVKSALAVSGVTALVENRIYPDAVPLEKGLPAISYSRINTVLVQTLDSAVAGTQGGFEIWCMADTRTAADVLGAAAQAACITGLLIVTNLRHEFDVDTKTYAAVLTVDVWD